MTLEDVRVKVEGAVTATISLIGRRTLHYTQGFIGLIVEFFLMLYLLYFWIRDGEKILNAVRTSIPVGQEIETMLFRKFAQVSRATLRGTVIVAMCQGLIGGILFGVLDIQGAVLWGVLMGVLSLLPVGGSAIIWAPTAFILFAQGHVTESIIIVIVGTLGIGLIDNILRPILVGREAKMPDYLVLLATIGGIAWFGLSSFIIGPVIAALFITCWEITGELFGGKE
jgi:predicted PurR-regulated permease PerM